MVNNFEKSPLQRKCCNQQQYCSEGKLNLFQKEYCIEIIVLEYFFKQLCFNPFWEPRRSKNAERFQQNEHRGELIWRSLFFHDKREKSEHFIWTREMRLLFLFGSGFSLLDLSIIMKNISIGYLNNDEYLTAKLKNALLDQFPLLKLI